MATYIYWGKCIICLWHPSETRNHVESPEELCLLQSAGLGRVFMKTRQLPIRHVTSHYAKDVVQGKATGQYNLAASSSQELPERNWKIWGMSAPDLNYLSLSGRHPWLQSSGYHIIYPYLEAVNSFSYKGCNSRL